MEAEASLRQSGQRKGTRGAVTGAVTGTAPSAVTGAVTRTAPGGVGAVPGGGAEAEAGGSSAANARWFELIESLERLGAEPASGLPARRAAAERQPGRRVGRHRSGPARPTARPQRRARR
jgi:hypothetical protein